MPSGIKHGIVTLAATLGLGLLASAPASPEAPPYRIVVNASRSYPALSRRHIADYFLKRASKLPDGTPVAVVDLSASSAARAAFSKEVLDKSVDAVVHYWQQQMFSGRDTPPAVKSEEEVLSFVGSTAGAIGYVSGERPLPASVKVLNVAQ